MSPKTLEKKGVAGGHTADAWSKALARYGDVVNETSSTPLRFEIPGLGPIDTTILEYTANGAASPVRRAARARRLAQRGLLGSGEHEIRRLNRI